MDTGPIKPDRPGVSYKFKANAKNNPILALGNYKFICFSQIVTLPGEKPSNHVGLYTYG